MIPAFTHPFAVFAGQAAGSYVPEFFLKCALPAGPVEPSDRGCFQSASESDAGPARTGGQLERSDRRHYRGARDESGPMTKWSSGRSQRPSGGRAGAALAIRQTGVGTDLQAGEENCFWAKWKISRQRRASVN